MNNRFAFRFHLTFAVHAALHIKFDLPVRFCEAWKKAALAIQRLHELTTSWYKLTNTFNEKLPFALYITSFAKDFALDALLICQPQTAAILSVMIFLAVPRYEYRHRWWRH